MTDSPSEQYAHAPASRPVPASNPVGTVSLILALVVILFSVVQQVFGTALPLFADALGGFAAVQLLLWVSSSIVGLVAFAALILGLIGVTRRGATKGAAGFGLGVGAFALLSVLVGLSSAFVIDVLV